jgi:uncharacterized membrane protein required for colicin V production
MLRNINWVDFVVVVILLRTIYIGATRGFWVELFRLLGTAFGLVISLRYYPKIAQALTGKILFPTPVLEGLTALGIFAVVLFAFKIMFFVIQVLMKVEFALGLEKVGGLVLGLARGYILASFLLNVALLFPSPSLRDSIKERSLIGKKLLKTAPAIYNFAGKFYPPEQNMASE